MAAHSEPPILWVAIGTRIRADRFKRAVGSVLVNSFADFELIVVDQSTDGKTAAALAMTVDDSLLRYIPTNAVGVAKSRNIAARESRDARGHDLSLQHPSLLTNRIMSPQLTSWLMLFALAVLLIGIVGIVLFTRLHAVL
jgi:glycosyltransferase involved in cell wall biosynthesis